MREVATADGTKALTDADRAALVAAAVYLFRQDEPLDPDRLDRVTPAELADAVSDPELADHTAQFLTVMATIDIAVDDAKIETVQRFAAALGVHEEYLRELAALAEGKLKWLAADVQRQNLLSITGKEIDLGEDDWLLPFKVHPDPALAARYAALGELPGDTLGHTFFDFYRQYGFAFPGEADGLNPEFATPHDSTHVLSGYDTSPQGELLVSTFTAGMHPEEPMSGHILPVIMTWHMGVELVKFTGKYTGGLEPEKFWVAWTRGGEVTNDTFARDWDFWHEAERPLAAVRTDYDVPPLEPRHAASGDVPDWYHPVA
ncbi:MAG TPA: hypothetical protein VF152_04710 [Acidimicrobiia bacterium]